MDRFVSQRFDGAYLDNVGVYSRQAGQEWRLVRAPDHRVTSGWMGS